MSYIAKLNLKTVRRNVQKDPVIARREKLSASIEEQRLVLSAALAGESYSVKIKRWQTNDAGDRVQVERDKQVRRWFFEQDGGYYVQCRYGSRILNIIGKSNAVFVDKLDDVADVLTAFKSAAAAGELDKAIALAAKARTA